MSSPEPFRSSVSCEADSKAFVHDVNNALEALQGLLHLLDQDKTLNEKSRAYVTLAWQEARRAGELARVAMGKAHDVALPSDIDVADLLRSVIEFYRSRFESHGIVINVRCCPNARLSVYPCRLRHAVSNLVLNAADAMPNGGRLKVRVARGEEWGGKQRQGLRVTVADNGSGITADHMPQLLRDRFTTKGDRGNGIGLTIVRDTLQTHQGTLRVRSSTTPGRTGSVFALFLPAA